MHNLAENLTLCTTNIAMSLLSKVFQQIACKMNIFWIIEKDVFNFTI